MNLGFHKYDNHYIALHT